MGGKIEKRVLIDQSEYDLFKRDASSFSRNAWCPRLRCAVPPQDTDLVEEVMASVRAAANGDRKGFTGWHVTVLDGDGMSWSAMSILHAASDVPDLWRWHLVGDDGDDQYPRCFTCTGPRHSEGGRTRAAFRPRTASCGMARISRHRQRRDRARGHHVRSDGDEQSGNWRTAVGGGRRSDRPRRLRCQGAGAASCSATSGRGRCHPRHCQGSGRGHARGLCKCWVQNFSRELADSSMTSGRGACSSSTGTADWIISPERCWIGI